MTSSHTADQRQQIARKVCNPLCWWFGKSDQGCCSDCKHSAEEIIALTALTQTAPPADECERIARECAEALNRHVDVWATWPEADRIKAWTAAIVEKMAPLSALQRPAMSEDALVATFKASVDGSGDPLVVSFKGWPRDQGFRFLARAVLATPQVAEHRGGE